MIRKNLNYFKENKKLKYEFRNKKRSFFTLFNANSKNTSSKNFFPMYYCIKMELKEDVLFLEINNSHIVVKIKIKDESLKVEEEGSLVLLGKNFIDIIKKIDYFVIKIASIENNFLIIKNDFSQYKLKLMDLNNYPSVDFNFDYQNYFEIEMELFKK